jgi:hypothetical protein
VINANIAAQVLGAIWFGIGVVVLIVFYALKRRPTLAGISDVPDAPDPSVKYVQ